MINKTKKFKQICKKNFFKINKTKTKKRKNNIDKIVYNFILTANKECISIKKCEFKIKIFLNKNLKLLNNIYDEHFLKVKNDKELINTLEKIIINILIILFKRKEINFFSFEEFVKYSLLEKSQSKCLYSKKRNIMIEFLLLLSIVIISKYYKYNNIIRFDSTVTKNNIVSTIQKNINIIYDKKQPDYIEIIDVGSTSITSDLDLTIFAINNQKKMSLISYIINKSFNKLFKKDMNYVLNSNLYTHSLFEINVIDKKNYLLLYEIKVNKKYEYYILNPYIYSKNELENAKFKLIFNIKNNINSKKYRKQYNEIIKIKNDKEYDKIKYKLELKLIDEKNINKKYKILTHILKIIDEAYYSLSSYIHIVQYLNNSKKTKTNFNKLLLKSYKDKEVQNNLIFIFKVSLIENYGELFNFINEKNYFIFIKKILKYFSRISNSIGLIYKIKNKEKISNIKMVGSYDKIHKYRTTLNEKKHIDLKEIKNDFIDDKFINKINELISQKKKTEILLLIKNKILELDLDITLKDLIL